MGSDIVIVGGGCTGTSIAYHLAALGAGTVTLLERKTLGSGTTAQSSGIVRQHYSDPTLARMAQRSLRVFEHFDQMVGGEVGFRRTGLLIGAREEDLAGLRASVAMQQELGIDTRMIGHDDLRALEPRMSCDDLVAACYEPEAGYTDPAAVTMAYAQRARALGATIRQGAMVTALLVDGARIRGVELADGTRIGAGTVIVASNIWGVPLLRAAGLDMPIHATRHPCILLQQPPAFGPQHMILFDFTNGLYLKPEGADLTLAGMLEEAEDERIADPDHIAMRPSHAEAEALATRTAQRFPILADATLQAGWAGLYDVSADWQPAIGPAPGLDGLYCAIGFSGHGFKLCPMVGEIVAAMALGQPVPDDLDVDLFRVDRFTAGHLARSRYAYRIIG
ncbi:MAG TPA: FAD-binding oxidoreductase [Chloroflexota bacterium]|nr:FAD-binding oxidoreductase [Chloroflexota bacterium]